MKPWLLCLLLFILWLPAPVLRAQTGPSTYVWPKDPMVRANLKRWQGYKFGIIVHEGLYSEMGIDTSWELCPEDWVQRKGYSNYWTFAQDYRNLKSTFNPVDFNPGKWAKAFKAAGAKYVIYTTKHHDGFCLFDTKYTNFKVTDKGCPFSTNRLANMTRAVFDACRKQGLAVGAYFSKPDWTCPDYWWPYYPPKDRNPNYNIIKHPRRWKKFITYTHNQLRELMTEYGKVDILWLDGCWVRPLSTINQSVAAYCKYPYNQDIDMKSIAAMARKNQPGLLIVDRWVQGPYENYLTPEQNVPDKPPGVPWESCITMGDAWSWIPHDNFKSSRELIQLLVKIVAKGGNLLLGIGPDGKGDFDPQVYERLGAMGRWLRANGEAIYHTVPVAPFQEGQFAYTAKGDHTVYAVYLPARNEKELPGKLELKTALKGNLNVSLPAFHCLLKCEPTDDGITVSMPQSLRTQLAGQPAVVIRVESSQSNLPQ